MNECSEFMLDLAGTGRERFTGSGVGLYSETGGELEETARSPDGGATLLRGI